MSFDVGIFVVLPPAAASIHDLLPLLGLLSAFLTLFMSTSSWMEFRLKTRVLLCRYCRVAAAGNLYFTGHGNGSCVGFSMVRWVHFRFLSRQSRCWLASYCGSGSCWHGCTASV